MKPNSMHSSSERMSNLTPPSLSWSVTLQRENGTPEQQAFCVLQFGKYESVVSV
jgi:hypothetical protein